MRIMCLGRYTSYVLHSSACVLTRGGHEVIAVNTAPGYSLTKITTLGAHEQPLLFNLTDLAEDYSGCISQLKEITRTEGVSLIYASWGRAVNAPVRALLSSGVDIPIAYALLCYPQAVLDFGNSTRRIGRHAALGWYLLHSLGRFSAEWLSHRAVLPLVQGRIFASDEMLQLARLLQIAPQINNLVLPDFLSVALAPRTRLKKLRLSDGEPHVVYIGNPVYSASIYDDVRRDLMAIAAAGVHVHFAEPDLPMPEHPYLHRFAAFNAEAVARGQLSDFMTQFDANLLMYHPYQTKRIRWRTTHPTRFLHGLLAGIPTVLPGNVFRASERIVRRHNVGHAFSGPIDLATWLKNEHEIERCSRHAQELAPGFTGEATAPVLTGFLESLR
jgi:hypothetical protein